MPQETEQQTEMRAVIAIIEDAFTAGCSVTIATDDGDSDDGEVLTPVEYGKDIEALKAKLNSTGQDHLYFFSPEKKMVGWVQLVYGNGDYSVITDNSANDATQAILNRAESILREAEAAA